MSKSLNLTIVVAVGCILVGCATEKSVVQKPMAAVETANSHLGRMSNVRTTAYTRKETGGIRNALGTYLSGRRVMSAAADWSRFPLGTRFKICSTREEFIIDDYGTALVGTNTIDLYKPTKLEMKRWGARNVDIDVLQWGSEQKSLEVLAPRAKFPQVQQMLVGLQHQTPSSRVAVTSSAKESSPKSAKKVASSGKESSKKSAKKVASTSKESAKKSDKKVASSAKESSKKSDKKVASSAKESSKKSDKKVASSAKESSKKSDEKVASSAKESSKKSDKKVASSSKKSGKKVASSSNQSSAKPPTSKQSTSKSSTSRTLD
jgi:3D (Asp-Asp-Asp) domain-containing protein